MIEEEHMEEQQKEMKKRRNLLLIFGISSCFVIVFLIIYSVVILRFFLESPSQLSDEPGYISSTKNFHQRMTDSLNVVEIQEWLNTLNEAEMTQLSNQMFRKTAFPIKVPGAIDNLGMSYIHVFKNDQNDTCVRLTWGGPVAHWGVVIGPKGMPIPETEDVSYDEEGYRNIGEYRIKLEDGAYVWHEIK